MHVHQHIERRLEKNRFPFTLKGSLVKALLVYNQSLFLISNSSGTTRNHHGGKHVLELEYECYKMMAEKEIRKLCDEVRLELPAIRNIAVHHRLGY